MVYKEKILAEIERLKKELYKQRDFRIDGSPIPVYDTNAIDGMLKVLDKVKGFINTLPSKQPSEDLEYLATSLEETIGTSPHSRETIISYLQQAAQWQKEQIINKACEWLRYCVDVNDEVKMIDGEPEAESLVQKNLHRIEVTNQIVEDFKKAMENE